MLSLMKMHRLGMLVVAGASALAAANDCDRSCLDNALTQYMNAVVKHDPAAAPLSAGFRQTEDSVVVRLGTGTWKSVTGLGKLQRHYMDAVQGQAAYFGVVEEGSEEAIVTVRVRVENRKITEAEWMIARKWDAGLNGPRSPEQPGGNFFNPEYLASNPPRQKMDPKQTKSPREAMLAATNSYFDGITTHDGSIIQAHQGCIRIENGAPPGSGRGGNRAGGTKAPGPPPDCTSGLQNINVELVAARRYPIVDEEAGVVLALAVFVRKPGTTTRRNVFSEWFTIDNNKIRTIYSAMFYPPPELPVPNWPPYEGNWPLPANIAAPRAK